MSPLWIEMRIRVPAAGLDLVTATLTDLGCEGVTVEERSLDTFVPPDPDEVPAGDYLIKAYFPAPADLAAHERQVRECLAELCPLIPGLAPLTLEVAAVRTEDWAENWKQHFSAVRIGSRLVIKPTWEDYAPRPGDAVVNLDPGMAFGTGTHGTTRLCLEALAARFDDAGGLERILDVGTGSGILAIAAAALGARQVLACDIDDQACQTARDNAALNGVPDQVRVTDQPLDALPDGFQLVLANILAEENVRLASELVRRLAPGGWLILSGILQEKEALVARAFAAFTELSGPEISRSEEWSCLVYRREA